MARIYYPGSEKACDACPMQRANEDDNTLSCVALPWDTTPLHWNCMNEEEA